MSRTLIEPCGDLPSQPYLQMDPEEREKQYSPTRWNNRGLTADEVIDAHIESIQKESDAAKLSHCFSVDVPYGSREKEKLDILIPESLSKDCPIFVYIHGGYWQLLGRELSAFASQPIVNAGGGFVTVGYTLAPEVTLQEIVDQVQSAVKYVLGLAEERGSKGVYLCGHSAGGHLAAMMLAVDGITETSQAPSLLKGVLLVSGVFDVRSVVYTSVNKALRLTESEAWDVSPFQYVDRIAGNYKSAEIKIAFGTSDSPEFRRQSEEFYRALLERGVAASLHVVQNTDHFTVIEQLCDPEYQLTKEILSLMTLTEDAQDTKIE